MATQKREFRTAEVSFIGSGNAAADNPFYQTSAAPSSLATLMRGHVLVRQGDQPISFPYAVEQVTGVHRRAG